MNGSEILLETILTLFITYISHYWNTMKYSCVFKNFIEVLDLLRALIFSAVTYHSCSAVSLAYTRVLPTELLEVSLAYTRVLSTELLEVKLNYSCFYFIANNIAYRII